MWKNAGTALAGSVLKAAADEISAPMNLGTLALGGDDR